MLSSAPMNSMHALCCWTNNHVSYQICVVRNGLQIQCTAAGKCAHSLVTMLLHGIATRRSRDSIPNDHEVVMGHKSHLTSIQHLYANASKHVHHNQETTAKSTTAQQQKSEFASACILSRHVGMQGVNPTDTVRYDGDV